MARQGDARKGYKENMMKYAWRDGAHIRAGLDVDQVGDELRRISAVDGLTPEVVVSEARDKESPLHGAFEWRDDVAAEEHRKQQARTLIRAVMIVSEDVEPSPAFYSIAEDRSRSYVPVEVVVRSKGLYGAALDTLRAKLAGAKHAVEQLQNASRITGAARQESLAPLVAHLDAAEEEARRL